MTTRHIRQYLAYLSILISIPISINISIPVSIMISIPVSITIFKTRSIMISILLSFTNINPQNLSKKADFEIRIFFSETAKDGIFHETT
jgi:hypothetical protein